MTKNRHWWGGVCMALVGLVGVTTVLAAGGDDVKAGIRSIAAAFAKGKADDAKGMAVKFAKKLEGLEELMDTMKLAKKGGIGVGNGVDKNNGIEAKLREIARDAPNKKDLDNLELMGYDIAAIAEVSIAKAPTGDKGKKKASDWVNWSKEMRDAGVKLAEAAKAGSTADVKAAATKANQACNSCHSVFR